jgi:hypothetical protein
MEKILKDGFKARGSNGSRFETLTDIIFGFSISLLVISSEVPKTYVELQASMYSFIGFIFCAVLLFSIWNDHKTFFLRYGMEDKKTNLLNFTLVFVILYYIYPMKYLFSYLGTVLYVKIKQALGDNSEGLQLAFSKLVEADLEKEQWADIMLRFSLGLFAIYLIFLLLYINAKHKRDELGLSPLEIYKTQTSIQEFLILVCITSLSILIVLIFGHEGFLYSSLNYLLIPILLKVHDLIRSKPMQS